MSDYPATLGDLSDVEARLDARMERIEKRQKSDAGATDLSLDELHTQLSDVRSTLEAYAAAWRDLDKRVRQLEGLWQVALENPDLVRELALQAMKGS